MTEVPELPDYLGLAPGTRLGAAVYVGDLSDGSEEWHAQRARVIGSSEVAPIVGIPGFRSKYTLWLEKAGLYKPAEPGEDTQELFDWGHILEPAIAEMFHRKMPDLHPVRTGTWVNVEHEWLGGNPDRFLLDENGLVVGILELKYSTTGAGWENGDAPHKYIAQLRYQLQIFGLQEGYLACLSSGKLLYFKVSVDETAPVTNMRTGEQKWYSMGGTEMVPLVQAFVDSLPKGGQPGTAPELDSHDETMEYVRSRHPDIDGKDIEVDVEMATEWAEARKAFDEAEARLKKVKVELLEFMGTAKRARIQGKTIANRQAKGGGTPFIKAVGKPFIPKPVEAAASADEGAPSAA